MFPAAVLNQKAQHICVIEGNMKWKEEFSKS